MAWFLSASHESSCCIFDLGVDERNAAYCRHHFHYISLAEDGGIPHEKAGVWQPAKIHDIERREAWFKKPLACRLTPFQRTFWLDIACTVLETVHELFDQNNRNIFQILAEDEYTQRAFQLSGLTAFDEIMYNSGVILYDRNCPLLQLWAEKARTERHHFMGDQDLLSRIIYERNHPVKKLPSIYNHFAQFKPHRGVKILHYVGDQKPQMIKDLKALLKQN